MGKSTISMAIFNSYVKFPEGIELYFCMVKLCSKYIHTCVCMNYRFIDVHIANFNHASETWLTALPFVSFGQLRRFSLLSLLYYLRSSSFFSNQAEERYKTRCIGRGDGSSLVFHCQVSVQSFAENWLSKFSAWYLQSLNLEKQQTMRRGKWFSCCVVSCWNLGGVHLAIGVWLFGPLRWKHVKNLWPVRCIFPRRNLDLGVQSCDPF